METPDKTTIDQWHRRFAVECNNTGWDLTALPERTTAQNDEMLDAAHAAAFHWNRVGKPINAARAWILLAHAHALSGDGAQAMNYARRTLDFCRENADQCQPWDIAFAHLEMALAAATCANDIEHAFHYRVARELGADLSDRERRAFEEEFGRVPAPPPES